MPAQVAHRACTRSAAYRPGNGLFREPAISRRKTEPARTSAEAYCREARRLRQRHAADPALLQQSLRKLSRQHDHACDSASKSSTRPASNPVTVRNGASTPFARAVVDWFAEHVAAQLDGRLIHYSQRQELLKTAERLGIGRFHANLLMAVAQHESDSRPVAPVPIAFITPAPRFSAITTTMLLLIVQSIIVYGAWRILFSV